MTTFLTIIGATAAVICLGMSLHGFSTGHPGRGIGLLILTPVVFFATAILVGVVIVGAVIAGLLWLAKEGDFPDGRSRPVDTAVRKAEEVPYPRALAAISVNSSST